MKKRIHHQEWEERHKRLAVIARGGRPAYVVKNIQKRKVQGGGKCHNRQGGNREEITSGEDEDREKGPLKQKRKLGCLKKVEAGVKGKRRMARSEEENKLTKKKSGIYPILVGK